MILEDLRLSTTDHTRFLKVIKPKVQSTIHVASALSPNKSKLDSFVMLSSSIRIIGNRGQVNYAAANTFLNVFAAQLGWVAENQHKVPMALAYGALSEELLLSILEYHMDTAWKAARSTQTCHTVVGIRSAQNFQRQCFPLPGFMAHPLFTPLQAIAGRSQAAGQVAEAPFSHGLREAATMEAAVKVVTRAIVHEVARIMALSVQEIDPQRSLGSYGVDFRMTVDFKAWFQREVGMSMGTAELLGELARTQLAQQAADASQFLPAELRGG
ncbi:ochratoxin highly reducing polyketide synthase ota1 [Aspergillus niger]|nr:ochratoxin highly reducing polyketide synthase ota1 [Aspergillus niger]